MIRIYYANKYKIFELQMPIFLILHGKDLLRDGEFKDDPYSV